MSFLSSRRLYRSLSILRRSAFTSANRDAMLSNLSRPANWKALAPAPPPQTKTFARQPSLPRLPVPELQSTARRLKETLAPLAKSEPEYAEAARKVDDFVDSEKGLGPVLQARLESRASEEGREHWLESWWDDGGYMGYRDSVVVNVSYFYGFNLPPAHMDRTPAARAAGLVRAALLFRRALRRGELEPEATKQGALCMDTYRWMFDCCRLPGSQGLDWTTSYAQPASTGSDDQQTHVTVLRKGRVWQLDATVDGRILSTDELQHQLLRIYCHTDCEYPGVGILGANNRDVWAKDYAELLKEPQNAAVLESIHSSAFVLCLDTESPADAIQHSRFLWHGACPPATSTGGALLGLRNRWVDKPVQFVVFDNGHAGIMGEHSVMDGTPTARMCDDVLDALYSESFDHGSPASTSDLPPPQPMDWTISSATATALQSATQAARELIESQSLSYLRTPYGKSAIKRFGISPDSWAQAVVQLAYRRFSLRTCPDVHPPVGATYEAASTRGFLKGRTEAIRVVTKEMCEWAESMDGEGVSTDRKKELLERAAKKHVALAKSAGAGQGVDRHMLGLKKLLKKGEEVPEIYSDPLFVRSSYWTLSTSAVFSKHFDVYGWGEVVPDGFGVAYMTGFDDCLQFTITSRTEMPCQEFCDEIAKAAKDMFELYAPPVFKPHL